jgi:hypothetical protein
MKCSGNQRLPEVSEFQNNPEPLHLIKDTLAYGQRYNQSHLIL